MSTSIAMRIQQTNEKWWVLSEFLINDGYHYYPNINNLQICIQMLLYCKTFQGKQTTFESRLSLFALF